MPPSATDDIAAALVEEGLAACADRLDCRSTYRREGEVVAEPEVVEP